MIQSVMLRVYDVVTSTCRYDIMRYRSLETHRVRCADDYKHRSYTNVQWEFELLRCEAVRFLDFHADKPIFTSANSEKSLDQSPHCVFPWTRTHKSLEPRRIQSHVRTAPIGKSPFTRPSSSVRHGVKAISNLSTTPAMALGLQGMLVQVGENQVALINARSSVHTQGAVSR
jgi:hypothetical protein